jgi:hypothetical protein
LGFSKVLNHGTADSNFVPDLDISESVAGTFKDKDTLGSSWILIGISIFFLKIEPTKIALDVGITILKVSDDNAFNHYSLAD